MGTIGDSYLGQAWLVLLLALGFGGTLAGVHVGLKDRVEANKRAETLSRIPELILGSGLANDAQVILREDGVGVETAAGETMDLRIWEREIQGHQVFEVTNGQDDTRIGWVARGSGPGYADQIEILIGLRPDASEITGLYVLSQKETPALGDGITRPTFRRRFEGVPTDAPLEVTKLEREAGADRRRILALSAATISSRSVCEIVNETVADLRSELPQ